MIHLLSLHGYFVNQIVLVADSLRDFYATVLLQKLDIPAVLLNTISVSFNPTHSQAGSSKA